MEKISILDITTCIRLDVAKKIKADKFIVVISAYDKIKEYLGFTIDGQPEIYENINGTFHFYDDFYDYNGDKNNKEEMEKYYSQFYHIYFNHIYSNNDKTTSTKCVFRIDYKPID